MKIKPTIAINDNGFLFDPNTGDSYTTNPVAREIIFMMKQNISNHDIQAKILDRYDVDEVTLEKNMIDFTAMLRYYNLCEENQK